MSKKNNYIFLLFFILIILIFKSTAYSKYVVKSSKTVSVFFVNTTVSEDDIVLNTTDLTNEDVIAKINDTTGTIIEYKVDENDNWKNYENKIILENNGTVYSRKVLGNEAGAITKKSINNIDKIPPAINKIEIIEIEKNYVKLNIDASDNIGISKYYYNIDNKWEELSNDFEIPNLTENTSYKLIIKITDIAGNETIAEPLNITTGMNSLEKEDTKIDGNDEYVHNNSDINKNDDIQSEKKVSVPKIILNKTTPTNEDVVITIDLDDIDGYVIQYQINKEEWRNYISPIIISENCTINAKAVNSDSIGNVVSENITNIDKNAPEILATAMPGNDYITVNAFFEDEGSDPTYIPTYCYYLNGNLVAKTQDNNYKFTNLKENQEYNIKITATDLANNEGIKEFVTYIHKPNDKCFNGTLHKHTDICNEQDGCGKTAGGYYNGSTRVYETCNEVVTSIVPIKQDQSIKKGDQIDTRLMATFLDGHIEIINATTSDYDQTKEYNKSNITLIYTGKIKDVSTIGDINTNITVTTK